MSREEDIREGTVAELYSYDIIINNVSYPNTFQEDIRTDRTILEDEFSTQADKYAYWSTLAALAKDQEAKLKRIMELIYAQADATARSEAYAVTVEDPKRKFTEKMYETMAKTSQEYQQAQLTHLSAKWLADTLSRATESFSQRKEMLISLGAHARVGATDVRVVSQHVRENIRNQDPEIKEEIVETQPQTNTRRKPKQQ